MASVNEIKEALTLEHQRTLEVADRAISAIDTMLNVGMWVMGALALAVAVFALLGYREVTNAARKKAEQVANKHVRDYIESDEFKVAIRRQVATATNRYQADQIAKALEIVHESESAPNEEDQEFPKPPGDTSQ